MTDSAIHIFIKNFFWFISKNVQLQRLATEHQVSSAIWCPVRHQTIKLLEQNKDEVLKIARDVRIAKIAGSATSLVVGGGLIIAGLILIPFTFGASVGLTLAGAGVGAAGTATSVGASIVSKVMSNSKVKKAREHINLDQQMSVHVNERGSEYNEAIKNATIVTDSVHAAVGVGGRLGVGVTKGIAAGIEAGVQAGSAAVRVGSIGLRAAAIAGGVVGRLALLVTAPLDIYQISKNSYEVATSGSNGENESDATCKWYMEQIKKMKKELDNIEAPQDRDDNDDQHESKEDDRQQLIATSTQL